MQNILIKNEADIFCKYLTGKKASADVVLLYGDALKKRPLTLDNKDKKILAFIESFPFFIGFIDGAMAFFKKNSAVRKRLFIMLAILETLPEYADFFLSKKHSFFYLFVVVCYGVRAVYRLIFGTLLLKLI